MGRKKVVHTLETILARTDEIGDCLEWQGIMQNNVPQIRIDRALLSVRRVIREMLGRPPQAGNFLSVRCGNQKCVNPDHIVERTMTQHMKIAIKHISFAHPLRIARIEKAAKVRRVLTDEHAESIRNDERSSRIVAAEFGCSRSLVNAIRRGEAYRPSATANPFAGLMR